MSKKKPDAQGAGSSPLEGSVRSAAATTRGLELVLRLRNPGARALHYIGNVRALRFDPSTKKLVVSMSDRGRTLVPGGLHVLPQFRVLDPNSEAELRLELPSSIVRLAENPPPGDIALEEQALDDVLDVQVDVAWAEVPFYVDPRAKSEQRLPSEAWQKDQLSLSFRIERGKRD